MWGLAADGNGHPRRRVPGGAQPEWHWESPEEAHVQQCPTEHPEEDRHEEPGHCHLPTAAVLQELHGSTHGDADPVQRLPSEAQFL